MSEWRDIASAPRDGTHVLVVESRRDSPPYFQIARWTSESIKLWITVDGDFFRSDEFTHWMPLPPLPEPPKGESA